MMPAIVAIPPIVPTTPPGITNSKSKRINPAIINKIIVVKFISRSNNKIICKDIRLFD